MSVSGRTSPEEDGPDGDRSPPDDESRDSTSTDKPVLEWTNEDWARWIDSGGGSLPTAAPGAAAGTPAAAPELAATVDEPDAERSAAAPGPSPAEAVPAAPDAPPPVAEEAGAFEAVAPDRPDGDPAAESTVPRVADGDVWAFGAVDPAVSASGTGAPEVAGSDRPPFEAGRPEVVEDQRSFEAVEPDVAVTDDSQRPAAASQAADGPGLTAAEVETPPAIPEPAVEAPGPAPATDAPAPPEAAPAFEPAAALAPEPDAGRGEVAGIVGGGAPEQVAAAAASDEAPPPSDGAVLGGDADDEWAAVSDHPWWESAPVLAPEPVVFGEDPPTQVEAIVAPPALEPVRPSRDRPPVRTTRPMPAPAPRPAHTDVIRSQAPERSHRVRSAFGLLGVAMSVGVVVAGLITVAIFAISLALRRAVG